MFQRDVIVKEIDHKKLSKYCKDINGLFYQSFKSVDGVLECVPVLYGFLGGGVYEYSSYDVYKNGKLIFKSRSVPLIYAYFWQYVNKYIIKKS